MFTGSCSPFSFSVGFVKAKPCWGEPLASRGSAVCLAILSSLLGGGFKVKEVSEPLGQWEGPALSPGFASGFEVLGC